LSALYHGLKLRLHLLLRRPECRALAARVKGRWLGDRDQYVVIEHPKCGRTWLRYMIHHAESLACGVPLRNTMHEVWYRRHALPRANYVHGFKPGRPIAEHALTLRAGDPRQRGFILMVRQPERVMLSYYHHLAYRDRTFSGTLADFVRDEWYGVANYVAWVEHYWRALASYPHVVLTYEALRADTAAQLARVLEFVGLGLPAGEVARIVALSTLEAMRAAELEKRYDVGWLLNTTGDQRGSKVRSGGAEPLELAFTPADLSYMAARYERSEPFVRLGYTSPRAAATS
jgi:hypothetical protein